MNGNLLTYDIKVLLFSLNLKELFKYLWRKQVCICRRPTIETAGNSVASSVIISKIKCILKSSS
jgi:hypothetical protein